MNTPVGNFNYPSAYRIGCGRLRELAPACRELGFSKPLVITDPGITKLPWFSVMTDQLQQAGLEYGLFSGVVANPVESNVTSYLL